MLQFSTLVEMVKDGDLTEEAVDKRMRNGSAKIPATPTALRAVTDGILSQELVNGWIEDGYTKDSARPATYKEGFIAKDGALVHPQLVMSGAGTDLDNRTEAMADFKDEFDALYDKYKEAGHITTL